MSEKPEKRWYRWDKMINEGKYAEVVEEFDERFYNLEKIVVGDMIRRDDCLKALGVSLIRENAIYQRNYGERKPKK